MTDTAIFTIVSNNYLHFARTLLQSVARHHPQARRYCVIVDVDLEPAAALHDEFQLLSIGELDLPDGDDFLFQYTVLELNTAVKPWALQHLLKAGHDRVIYIDPDIQLYRPMDEVTGLLASESAQIVLTPHLLAPIEDDAHPGELDIRRAGTYNLGFCAVRNTPDTLRFLVWWQGKLRRDCVVAHDRGVFVDQSWVDLVPGLFDRVAILRHPGYNVAYWNLAQRQFSGQPGDFPGYRVNGQPLVFFHFSGLNPLSPGKLSKHQSRYTLESTPVQVQSLVADYCERVIGNGIDAYGKLPYGFGCFQDGSAITDAQRARFRTGASLRRQSAGKPFARPELFKSGQYSAVQAATTSQAASDLPFSLGGRRLQRIYRELLGRAPDDQAIAARLNACASSPGALKTLLSVGLSTEARSRPGWLHRLISLAAEVGLTPRWMKEHVLTPLLRWLPQPSMPEPLTDASPPSSGAAPGGRLQRLAGMPAPDAAFAPGINIVGYVRAELGLGEAVRSLARACHADTIPFSLTDVGYQSQNLQRDTSIEHMATAERFAIDLLYVNADQTPATVAQLHASGRSPGRYTIGFWHWEQPELPQQLLGAFAHVDEVWVPSTFVRDAVAAVSPVPVYQLPHAVEFEPGPQASRAAFALPDNRMLILVMYDFHSYQYRKNPQAAIAAFRQAARQYPEMGLVIKTINGQHHAQALAELRASVADLPHVYFIDEFLTRQQTWDLQSCCDVLLSLHRAEGFGLAPAEMMRLGKPVVATGWSANMDFMTPENSMPVRYRLQPLAEDVGAYKAGPLWAEADIDHAAACLVQLATDPALAQRLGRQAALDIRRQLAPVAVGRLVSKRLRMLARWYPPLAN